MTSSDFTGRETVPARADFLVVDAVVPNRSAATIFPANREKNREKLRNAPKKAAEGWSTP
jgi:hypothetical protein